MKPWETLATCHAPDGTELRLRRRGDSFLILAGGHDLMSSEDDASSRALATLACSLVEAEASRILIGGLGMGFTLRAALDSVGPKASVDVCELVPEVVEWNRTWLGGLASTPLDDPRTTVVVGDVADYIASTRSRYHAILLDVDNGPDALAHEANHRLYQKRGLTQARDALVPRGVYGVWSFSDEPRFTERLATARFKPTVHRVPASRKGRGRTHVIWTARRGD